MEELWEMDGEPVWVVSIVENPDWKACWRIVEDYMFAKSLARENRVYYFLDKYYGKTWIAYQRKPEEWAT